MEQFDSFNPVKVDNILEKVQKIGFTSYKKEIENIKNILQISDHIIVKFVESKQNSLVCFFLEYQFLKYQSKSKTYEYFRSYLNTLEQYNTKQSALFLYFYSIDNCTIIAQFYIKCSNNIRYITKTSNSQSLDSINLKFNDIINLAQLTIEEITVDDIISLISIEIQQNAQQINPLIEISSSYLIQLLLTYQQNKQKNTSPFQTPQKSNKKEQYLTSPQLQGFYKWGSPIFSQQEFQKNPINQKLLEDLDIQAKKYPKSRGQTSNQRNYYSPLTPGKTRSDFASQESVISELIKLKTIPFSTSKKSPSSFKEDQQSELQEDQQQQQIIKNNGCVFHNQIPNNQKDLMNIIKQYSIEYFDPEKSLPEPLNINITYENIIDLYSELEIEPSFNKQNFISKQYFSSFDPRYLKLQLNESILAISEIEGWILAKNEFGHVGCCAKTYIQRI